MGGKGQLACTFHPSSFVLTSYPPPKKKRKKEKGSGHDMVCVVEGRGGEGEGAVCVCGCYQDMLIYQHCLPKVTIYDGCNETVQRLISIKIMP